MAIEKLSREHSDFHVRGGLQYVGITEFSNITSGSYPSAGIFTSTAGNHSVDLQQESDGVDLTFRLFEAKQGSASFTQSGTKEGTTITYEQTVSLFIPNVDMEALSALDKLENENLAVLAITFSGEKLVLGVSELFKNISDVCNINNYARMTALEVSSGAALGDDNGVTLTLSCNSQELVRTLYSTVAINSSDSTGTLVVASH